MCNLLKKQEVKMELKLPYQKEYDKQVRLIEELQEKGFNIITCPDCGSVIITRRKQIMIKCYDCGEKNSQESCPDLFY